MLSVVVPVYNWDINILVKTIQEQCLLEKIPFEIIVLDDASSNQSIQNKNQQITSLAFVYYIQLDENVGNAEARNLLAKKAQFDWLLFLDADVLPTNSNFINNYWQKKQHGVVFSGGLIYNDLPNKNVSLRWKFGKKFEQLSVKEREKQPYLNLRGCNFFIEKSIFLQHPFETLNVNYGFVDTNFALQIKEAKIPIYHIENPVYHLGLEKNIIFIKKYEKAIKNAFWMMENNPTLANQLRIVRTYKKIKNWGLKPFVKLFYKLFRGFLIKNLKSRNPSLFFFQIYKLGYLCSLKSA